MKMKIGGLLIPKLSSISCILKFRKAGINLNIAILLNQTIQNLISIIKFFFIQLIGI